MDSLLHPRPIHESAGAKAVPLYLTMIGLHLGLGLALKICELGREGGAGAGYALAVGCPPDGLLLLRLAQLRYKGMWCCVPDAKPMCASPKDADCHHPLLPHQPLNWW